MIMVIQFLDKNATNTALEINFIVREPAGD